MTVLSPEVSVIIVNYNGGEMLTETLHTLEKFTDGIEYEAIVVDNASTKDNVVELIRSFKNVSLIKSEKGLGYAGANNAGVKIARGKYLCIINNDMIFIENVIKDCIDFIKASKNRVFVGPKILNRDMSLQISIGKFDTLWYIFSVNFFLYLLFPKSKLFNKYYYNYKNFTAPTEVDLIKGCFMVMEKKEFDLLGGFHEDSLFYGEETELCFRFWQTGGKVIFLPTTRVVHLGGGVSKSMPWFIYRYQAMAKIRTYRKFLPRWQFIPALFFHYCGLILRIPVYLAMSLFKFDKEILYKSYYYFRQLFIYPEK